MGSDTTTEKVARWNSRFMAWVLDPDHDDGEGGNTWRTTSREQAEAWGYRVEDPELSEELARRAQATGEACAAAEATFARADEVREVAHKRRAEAREACKVTESGNELRPWACVACDYGCQQPNVFASIVCPRCKGELKRVLGERPKQLETWHARLARLAAVAEAAKTKHVEAGVAFHAAQDAADRARATFATTRETMLKAKDAYSNASQFSTVLRDSKEGPQ